MLAYIINTRGFVVETGSGGIKEGRGEGLPRVTQSRGWHPNESLIFLWLNYKEHWANDQLEGEEEGESGDYDQKSSSLL